MPYFKIYSRFYDFRSRIRLAWQEVSGFRPIRWYLGAALVLQIIAWMQAMMIFRGLTGGFLILHYNVSLGVDLVGSPSQVFSYPLFGLGIAVFNLLIIFFGQRARDFKIIANLLLAAALIFNLLVIAALFSIYLTNFRY